MAAKQVFRLETASEVSHFARSFWMPARFVGVRLCGGGSEVLVFVYIQWRNARCGCPVDSETERAVES